MDIQKDQTDQAQDKQPLSFQHQIKKELEGILEDAKNIRSQIKRNSTIAENKLLGIESFEKVVNILKEKVENSETGIDATYNSVNALKQQTEEIKNNSQQKLEEINNNLEAVSLKVTEIEEFYTKFEDLRDKVEDEESGLQAILNKANALKQQTEEIKNNSQQKLEEINNNLEAVSLKVTEIEEFYTKFEDLRDKVEDEESGLQAILGVVTDLKNQIVKSKAGGDENLRQIKNIKEESDKLKGETKINKEEIEKYKSTSEKYKNDIEKTFKIATDVSLANSFNERKKELKTELEHWLKHLKWSIIFLALGVIAIYFSQYISNGDKPTDWKFWYRFAFTSPIVFYVYFASHNYNKNKDLFEKYAFKFALSLSLQSYVELLSKNFPEEKHKNELLEFSLDSIKTVYKEPYVEKNKKKKFLLGIKSIFNFGIEDEDTMEALKIKDNINDKEKEDNKKIIL